MTRIVLVAVVASLTTVAALRPRTSPRELIAAASNNLGHRHRQTSRRWSSWHRSGQYRRERELDHAVPELFDLFVVSLQAGTQPSEALGQLVADVHPSVAVAILKVTRRMEQGERFVNAIDSLVDVLGTRLLGFVAAVSAAERTGLPLAPTIDRIADDAREHRRRSTEIEARRLPVRLAVPLVCCTLPSFIAIAIGPILIGALSSLRSL